MPSRCKFRLKFQIIHKGLHEHLNAAKGMDF